MVFSENKKNSKKFNEGLNLLSRVLKYKVLNKLYFALTSIKNSKINRQYKKILSNNLYIFRLLEKKMTLLQQKNRKFAYDKLKNSKRNKFYKEILSSSLYLFRSIERKIKSSIQRNYQYVYDKLKHKLYRKRFKENVSFMFFRIKSLVNKYRFKSLLGSFNVLKNYTSLNSKKMSIMKLMKIEYLFKRSYIKKIAYAFM